MRDGNVATTCSLERSVQLHEHIATVNVSKCTTAFWGLRLGLFLHMPGGWDWLLILCSVYIPCIVVIEHMLHTVQRGGLIPLGLGSSLDGFLRCCHDKYSSCIHNYVEHDLCSPESDLYGYASY